MTVIGFEQPKDPCVFRKVDDGEVDMVVVVHVDHILVHAKDQATMERFAAGIGKKLKLKGMLERTEVIRANIGKRQSVLKGESDFHRV